MHMHYNYSGLQLSHLQEQPNGKSITYHNCKFNHFTRLHQQVYQQQAIRSFLSNWGFLDFPQKDTIPFILSLQQGFQN